MHAGKLKRRIGRVTIYDWEAERVIPPHYTPGGGGGRCYLLHEALGCLREAKQRRLQHRTTTMLTRVLFGTLAFTGAGLGHRAEGQPPPFWPTSGHPPLLGIEGGGHGWVPLKFEHHSGFSAGGA